MTYKAKEGSANGSFFPTNNAGRQPQYPGYTSYTPFNPKFPSFTPTTSYDAKLNEIRRRKRLAAYNQQVGPQNPLTDPYRINSLSDVLFNSAAKNKKYGEKSPWIEKTTRALFDMTNEQYIQPLFKGDFKSPIVNSLVALGEDLDVLANPIKGMISEAKVGEEGWQMGLLGAAAGGVAVALSGPVGWAAILGGALAGGGIAAATTAAVKDYDAAMLGFNRGLGIGNDGKYQYNLDTGNFITDIVAEIALDPFSWAAFGGKAIATKTSEGMKTILGTAAKTGDNITMKQLLNVSENLMDGLYIGTQMMNKTDEIFTKMALNATPLGVTWKAASGLRESTKVLLNNSLFAPKAMDSGQVILNPISLTEESKAHKQLMNYDRIVKNLGNDLVKTGRRELLEIIPSENSFKALDTYLISAHIGMSKAAHTKSVDAIQATVPKLAEIAMRDGSIEGFSTFARQLTDTEVSNLALERYAYVLSMEKMTEEAIIAGKQFGVNFFNTLPENPTKLDVLAKLEETLADLMEANKGTPMSDLLHAMKSGSMDLTEHYGPTLDNMNNILKGYGISPQEFVAFTKRSADVAETIVQMGDEAVELVGMGKYSGKAINVDKAFSEQTRKQLNEFQRMLKGTREISDVVNKEIGPNSGKVMSVLEAQNSILYKNFYNQPMYITGIVKQRFGLMEELLKSAQDTFPGYKPDLSAMEQIKIRFSDIEKSTRAVYTMRNNLEGLYKQLPPELGKLSFDAADPLGSLVSLKKAMGRSDVTYEMLSQLEAVEVAMLQFRRTPDLMFLLQQEINELIGDQGQQKILKGLAGQSNEKLAMAYMQEFVKYSENFGLVFRELSPHRIFGELNQTDLTYYMLQASKTQQYFSLAASNIKAAPKFFEDVADSSSPLNRMYRNIVRMDMETAGFGSLKSDFIEIMARAQGNSAYVELLDNVSRLLDTRYALPEAMDSIMDVVTRLSTLDPSDFLKALDKDIPEYLQNNLSKVMGIGPETMWRMTQDMNTIFRQYAEGLVSAKVPQTVYLPGSYFNEYVDRFLEVDFADFLQGMKMKSEELAAFAELKSLSENAFEVINNIGNVNKNLNELVYISSKIDDVTRMNISGSIGLKNIDDTARFSHVVTEVDKKKSRTKAALKKGMDFPTKEERITSRVKEKMKEAIDAHGAIDLLKVTDDMYTDEIPDLVMALRSEFESQGFGTAKERLENMEKLSKFASFQRSNDKILTEVGALAHDLVRLDINKSPLSQTGSVNMAHKAQAFTMLNMPAEDIASVIKYNSNSGFVIITNSILPFDFSEQVAQELSEFGILIKKSDHYTAIKVVNETEKLKQLTPTVNKYSADLMEFMVGDTSKLDLSNVDKQIGRMNQMYESVLHQIGKTSPFDASNHSPVRLDQGRVQDFIARSPEIAELIGGPEKIREYLNTIPRSRGVEMSFIGDMNFFTQLTQVAEGTTDSLMAKNLVMGNFNTAMSVVDQNQDYYRWFNLFSDPTSQLSNMFRGLSSEEAVKVLRTNKDMRVAYFTDKGKVHSFNIRNVKDYEKAVAKKAILTDSSNYSMMYRSLNQYKLENLPGGKILSKWQNNVQAAYSAFYLGTPGAVSRNYTDATMKNMIMSGDATVFKTQFQASNILEEVGELIKLTDGDISDSVINDHIAKLTTDKAERVMKRAKYDLVREYVESSASGGELQAVLDRQVSLVKQSGKVLKEPTLIQKVSYDNPVTKFFLNGFSQVEDMARFGLFLDLKGKGMSSSKVLDSVMKTHFDYTTRTPFELYLQTIIPFITFPLRNFVWWAEHAADNPIVFRNMTSTVVDGYVHDPYRAKNLEDPEKGGFNREMLMSGTIQRRDGDYNTLLKLNPSMFDAFSLVPGMITNPSERVAAPLKNLARMAKGDVKKWDDLEYPAQANIKRFVKMVNETGPAVVAGLQDKDEDWRFTPQLMGSLFNVSKYTPKEYEKVTNRFKGGFIPKTRFKPSYPRHVGRTNYGAPTAYRAKGGSLSTGFVTKRGKFMASGGIGYGNAQYRRNYDMDISFGKYGAYLRNAPTGVYLKNHRWQQRSVYSKMYSKSGNSRLLNRARTINDPRGLMFRLQDMKFNMF